MKLPFRVILEEANIQRSFCTFLLFIPAYPDSVFVDEHREAVLNPYLSKRCRDRPWSAVIQHMAHSHAVQEKAFLQVYQESGRLAG